MGSDAESPLDQHVADTLSRQRDDLVRWWLDRILARLGGEPREVFPTSMVLDHMPDVMGELQPLLQTPGLQLTEAAEYHLRRLANLRLAQGYDIRGLLMEFQILGAVLFEALEEAVENYPGGAEPGEEAGVARRLYEALLAMVRLTVGTFVEQLADVRRQEEPAQRRRLLRMVVEEVFKDNEILAEQRGVRLETDEPLPDFEVDATRVQIVLVNLVGNAIKYSDPDQPDGWIRVGAEEEDDGEGLLVRVTSSAVEIPPELENRVFQRFFRPPPKGEEATGLDLAIAREMTEQLGGRMWFERRGEDGTIFCFTIPPAAHERPAGGERPQEE